MRQITRFALWLSGLSFVSLAVLGVVLDPKESEPSGAVPEAEVLSVLAGAPWRVRTDSVSSVNGYHVPAAAAATFTDEAGAETELVLRGVDGRALSEKGEIRETEFDAGKLEQAIEPAFVVDVPSALAGKKGKVELTGVILIAEAKVDLLAREFGISPEVVPLEWSRAVSISAPDAELEGATDVPAERDPVPYRRPLEVARNLFVGCFLFGLGLAIVNGIGTGLAIVGLLFICVPLSISMALLEYESSASKSDRSAQDRRSVAPGSTIRVSPSVSLSTVDSFQRIAHLSVWLQGADEQQIELEAKASNNKPWSDPIQVGYIRKGPFFKTNRFPVQPALMVTLPPKELLKAPVATLHVSGVLVYPDLGRLEILNPLDLDYELGELSFSVAIALRFESDEPVGSATPENERRDLLLSGSAGLGLLLLAFGVLRGLVRRAFA